MHGIGTGIIFERKSYQKTGSMFQLGLKKCWVQRPARCERLEYLAEGHSPLHLTDCDGVGKREGTLRGGHNTLISWHCWLLSDRSPSARASEGKAE